MGHGSTTPGSRAGRADKPGSRDAAGSASKLRAPAVPMPGPPASRVPGRSAGRQAQSHTGLVQPATPVDPASAGPVPEDHVLEGRALAASGPMGRALAASGPMGRALAASGPMGRALAASGPMGRALAASGPMGRALAASGPMGRATTTREERLNMAAPPTPQGGSGSPGMRGRLGLAALVARRERARDRVSVRGRASARVASSVRRRASRRARRASRRARRASLPARVQVAPTSAPGPARASVQAMEPARASAPAQVRVRTVRGQTPPASVPARASVQAMAPARASAPARA
jgi:hypothetical protein